MAVTVNSPWTKTALWMAAAGLCVGLVLVTRPTSRSVALISDQGTPVAPDLKDPLEVRSLEVMSFDEQAVKMRAFKVESDGKSWKIPSASNYPADAQEGVAKATSAFTGLVRERFVSDNKADHAKFGLIDPTDETALSNGGKGTKVTFRDASGKPLVDVVIGKAVDASEPGAQAGARKRYIRESGKNRVYVTTIDGAFSTKFADWVETDLLKLTADKVKSLEIDRYSIDEKTGRIESPSTLKLSRNRKLASPMDPPGTPAAWTGWDLTAEPGPGGPGPDEVLDSERANMALNALSQLKIVGVQPKPANLVKSLSKAESSVALDMNDQLSLRRHGFFIAQQLGLVANEGTMSITQEDGVVYQLMLGELAGEADAAAAGGQVGGDTKADGKAVDEKKTDARFVMVIASFDASVVPEPGKTAELVDLEAKEKSELPNVSEETRNKLEPLRKAYQDKVDERKNTLEAGRKRADELAARFATWYYLVDLKSLDQIRPVREQLVVKAAANNSPDANMPQVPGGLPLPMQVEPPK